jgi:transglutaminase-like putative cysteine protease
MSQTYKKLVGVLLCLALLFQVASPAVAAILPAVASGTVVHSNSKAKIDASNVKDGYIMVAYTAKTQKRIKVRVTGPDKSVYTYDLNNTGKYEAFPLSAGEGKYKVGVYENTSGNKYALAYSSDITVMLTNDFAPFLRPNQYVNFTENSAVVKQAAVLVKDKKNDLEKITAVYNYVIKELTYDKEKAKTVRSGYIPDVDKVLASKKGICFDYASLMAAMLRSQGIPTKLVIGYAGNVYHAWIHTYIPEKGWIEGVIFFDGTTWKLMDPTYASSSKQSKTIMEFIGNGSNYSSKYIY